MYWTAFVYHFLLASEISMLGTSIPLVMEFAKSHDMHPLLLGMIWTFSAGGKLFAYQSGVLIVGYSYGYFAARDLLRMGAWLTVIEFLALLLMVPFYWPRHGSHTASAKSLKPSSLKGGIAWQKTSYARSVSQRPRQSMWACSMCRDSLQNSWRIRGRG
jgi:hypothetical protein